MLCPNDMNQTLDWKMQVDRNEKIQFQKDVGLRKAEVFYNVNYSVKNSTVYCKYLLFLQDFFFRLKPKQYKNANIADCLKNHLETHKK